MGRYDLTPNRRAKLKKWREEGVFVKTIARRFGVSTGTIYRWINICGIPTNHAQVRRTPKRKINQVLRMIDKGENRSEIMRATGLGRKTIEWIQDTHGIPRPGRGNGSRISLKQKNHIDEILSESPFLADVKIAKLVGVSDCTVGTRRKALGIKLAKHFLRDRIAQRWHEIHKSERLVTDREVAKEFSCAQSVPGEVRRQLGYPSFRELHEKQSRSRTPSIKHAEQAITSSRWNAQQTGRSEITTPAHVIAQIPDRCPITGMTTESHLAIYGRRLSTDHCPIEGKVRGKLSGPINHALGFFGDTPEEAIPKLKAAIAYLESPFPEDVMNKATPLKRSSSKAIEQSSYATSA